MFEYRSCVDTVAVKIIVHAISVYISSIWNPTEFFPREYISVKPNVNMLFHTILLDQYESNVPIVVMCVLYFSSSSMYDTECKRSLKWCFNMSPNRKVSYHVLVTLQ